MIMFLVMRTENSFVSNYSISVTFQMQLNNLTFVKNGQICYLKNFSIREIKKRLWASKYLNSVTDALPMSPRVKLVSLTL